VGEGGLETVSMARGMDDVRGGRGLVFCIGT